MKAIQTKRPFSKVRIQLFSIKEVEIALFPDFYGNCITTAAPLIYEKSLLSVWKGQCVEYVWNALSYRVLRRKNINRNGFCTVSVLLLKFIEAPYSVMAQSLDFWINSALPVSISYSNPFCKAGIQFSIQMFTMNMLHYKKSSA